MHDLDRGDLVFESAGLEELEDEEVGDEDETDEQGVFDEVEESELASELLSVTDDHELDQFIGKLFKKAARSLRPFGGVLKQNLGGLLKGAVKKVLPMAARFAGGAIGGPAGAMVAGNAAPYLSSLLGMELEGLSPEDQEFEAAKQLVRMAGEAIANATDLAASSPAPAAARDAVIAAARRHAPGLLRGAARHVTRGAQRGTWYRRGNTIVIEGV